MDDVAWGALTITLTVLGLLGSWLAFRRRGAASGLRILAFALLPLAAYLTRTLRMFTRIVDAIADWATSLVFNPMVWSGVAVFGLSVVLFLVSGFLRGRQLGAARAPADSPAPRGEVPRREVQPPAGQDDGLGDLDDIEAILRKRGIS